jgi:hypothetical protein
MRNQYQTILALARQRPGTIIDYGQIKANMHNHLRNLFHTLGLQRDQYDEQALLAYIETTTRRDNRQSGQATFLGEQPGPITGSNGKYEGILELASEDVTECYAAYHEIRAMQQRQWEAHDQSPCPVDDTVAT